MGYENSTIEHTIIAFMKRLNATTPNAQPEIAIITLYTQGLQSPPISLQASLARPE